MARVVPEQMIGPRTRLAQRVHVGAAEKIGLHIHLQDLQLADLDAFMNPLMRRIETPRVPAHADHAGLLLHLQQIFRIL